MIRKEAMKIILEEIDKNHVLIDGDVRRKKCNKAHLEPLGQVLKLGKKASHEEVAKVFKAELGIELKEKKPKAKPAPAKEAPKKE